jgi:integrase
MPKVALTDRFVQGIKTSEIQEDFFDDNPKTRGLCLRVASTGRKTWCMVFTSPKDGKRARIVFGVYPGLSLAQARPRALEAHQNLEEGRDPRDVAAEEAVKALTVEGLVERWLEQHARPNLRSADEVERRLAKNVTQFIGTTKIADIAKPHMNLVVDKVLARGSKTEARCVFEDLRAVARWAVGKGLLTTNPFEGMVKPNGSKPRTRTLSDAEIKTVWSGLPTALARSKACQRILRLCLITAQRLGEVTGMERSELDLKARTWTIPEHRSKNKHAHVVPLSDMAVETVKEALSNVGKDAKWLFPAKDGDGPLAIEVVDKTVKRALQPDEECPLGRFGTAPWTPHDLRRTVLTQLAKMGTMPIVIGAVANHLSVTKANVTFANYVQYDYAKEKREALDAWARRLTEIVSGNGERADAA